jgi:hypothetical protein
MSLPCRAGASKSAPVVAVSGNHVYVAWADTNHGIFFTDSIDGGSTFSPPVNVVSMGVSQPAGVQIAASGDSVFLLSSCGNCGPNAGQGWGQLSLSMSGDFGQSFSTTTLSSTYGACCGQIAASQNNAYVVWDEGVLTNPGVYVVTFRSSSGVTLGAPLVLSNPSNLSMSPQLAVSGSHVYVAWDDRTTGAVMLASSANGGAPFGSASNLLPRGLPGLAAAGSNVYALSAAPSPPSVITLTASNDSGNTFAPQQVLNNSPLVSAGLVSKPQIAARGSSAFVIWQFPAPPSSPNGDIGFAYSTSSGATFGGPVNLSNNPEDSELTFGTPSSWLLKVDEMAVSAGRVHIVWYDCATSSDRCVVKYVAGALVPSAFVVSSTGPTSVTTAPSGETVVSQTDSSNNLLAAVTLPLGASVPSGTMALSYSAVGANSTVQVSGVTVPYPPGKSVTMLVDPSASTICITDQASGTSLPGAACGSTNTAASQVVMPCDGVSRIFPQFGQPPFPDPPGSRTYTCTMLSGAVGTTAYMKVDGLAYSRLQSQRPDTTPPVTSATVSPGANASGWNNTNVSVTLNATDDEPDGSGVKEIHLSLTGAQTGRTVVSGSTASVTIAAEGSTTLTYFGVDNAGNQERPKTRTVRIDKTPPRVSCSVRPKSIWPPNHKMVSVKTSVAVSDSVSGSAGFTLTRVRSNEPLAHGDIQGFVVGTPATAGKLVADRLGTGKGRVYTLTYNGLDVAGNSALCQTAVTVPHDEPKKSSRSVNLR